jgi:ferredoxin
LLQIKVKAFLNIQNLDLVKPTPTPPVRGFLKIKYNNMKRDILKIDEELCNGCGECVPNCVEGALQVIDGKVRLVSELMCDGLGACIGHCPEGAITIESREAEPYDEIKVMEQMKDKGKNTIIAHLKHLKNHGEREYVQQGVSYLKEHRAELNFNLDEVIHEVHNTSWRSNNSNCCTSAWTSSRS